MSAKQNSHERRDAGFDEGLPFNCPTNALRRRRREAGVFAIMSVPLLIVLIALCGLALEVGMVYNRVVDLHGMAKAVAIAAARQLNGRPDGLLAAQAKARETAEYLKYQYFGRGISFTWNDAALSFGATSSRSGEWFDASSGSGRAASLFYAKVDTAALDPTVGTVDTIFIRLVAPALNAVRLSESAVAGRSAINVTPIGICAMGARAEALIHTTAGGSTVRELVQYGFRRGVSYDLMQLNPTGTQAARFAVNPVVSPGGPATAFNPLTLPPFACTGTMWVPRISGGPVRVTPLASTSPLAGLHAALNSRFDMYNGGPCDASGAPPDFNVRAYAYNVANGVRWMNPAIGNAAAATTTSRGKLETVADLTTPPASAGLYGPLWAYARAAKAPTPADSPEPAGGYATFITSDWPTIYKSGPTASGYPTVAQSPYLTSNAGGGHYTAPRPANLEISTLHRRVLNIPLLSCTPSVPSGTNAQVNVEAIGKFFMTVPATQDALIAEFAGVLPEASLRSQVELFP